MGEKNRIFAISGMPASGKSTTIKNMIKELEESGVKSENIHKFSTGSEFRKYIEAISELAELNTDEISEEGKEYLRKLYTLSGMGRDELIKIIANVKKNNNKFNIAAANKEPEFAKVREAIDTIIDRSVVDLGKEINSGKTSDEIWIFDSRLAFSNIPSSFSVRTTIRDDIAGKRAYNDSTRGEEDKYDNIDEAIEATKKRKEGERSRYLERYGVDLEDERNYNLIIDTSFAKSEEVAKTILKCEELERQGKPYDKLWASPKQMLPLQTERLTLGMGSEETIDSIVQKIKQEGYRPNEGIDVVEVDGEKYIIEGHHRNFGNALAGNTLIPYHVLNKEGIMSDEEARRRSECCNTIYLASHAWMLDSDGKFFNYEETYPKIWKKFNEREKNTKEEKET